MSSPAEKTRAEKIYDAAFAEPPARQELYADFNAIVRQLRRDCPWDRKQTHASVRHLLIEECYEVVDAIEAGDEGELQKELGDVFLHVLFHSAIAEEAGRFTVADVMRAEMDKLVRRHPHVFGEAEADDVKADDEEAVLKNWEAIKREERADEAAGETPASTLDGVPRHLPALLRAYRTQQKAADVGFDFPEKEQAWAKVKEETAEFQERVEGGAPTAQQEDELGDLLFAVVNYARLAGLNPENALRGTTDKFGRRFRHIEAALGDRLADASLDEMDALWEEAKTGEGERKEGRE